jgi:hypothetical protein
MCLTVLLNIVKHKYSRVVTSRCRKESAGPEHFSPVRDGRPWIDDGQQIKGHWQASCEDQQGLNFDVVIDAEQT